MWWQPIYVCYDNTFPNIIPGWNIDLTRVADPIRSS